MVRQPEQPAENILVIQKFSVLFDILSGNTVKKNLKKTQLQISFTTNQMSIQVRSSTYIWTGDHLFAMSTDIWSQPAPSITLLKISLEQNQNNTEHRQFFQTFSYWMRTAAWHCLSPSCGEIDCQQHCVAEWVCLQCSVYKNDGWRAAADSQFYMNHSPSWYSIVCLGEMEDKSVSLPWDQYYWKVIFFKKKQNLPNLIQKNRIATWSII